MILISNLVISGMELQKTPQMVCDIGYWLEHYRSFILTMPDHPRWNRINCTSSSFNSIWSWMLPHSIYSPQLVQWQRHQFSAPNDILHFIFKQSGMELDEVEYSVDHFVEVSIWMSPPSISEGLFPHHSDRLDVLAPLPLISGPSFSVVSLLEDPLT